MRHGSLFSGIGGFDLAAEWMGWENVFHCEWMPFPRKVLKYYWPDSISYENIYTTDFTAHRGQIDILTGGFPCQPYSSAGKRLGKEDSRHLWPEMLRAIQEIEPTYIVGENVRGLTNWNRGVVFEEVCTDLESCGYEVQPVLLPACSVNAPHRRDRIWFVAYSKLRSNRLPKERRLGMDGTLLERCEWKKETNGFDINTNDERTATNTKCKGFHISTRTGEISKKEGIMDEEKHKSSMWTATIFDKSNWENFPTQSPVRLRDDGVSDKLAIFVVNELYDKISATSQENRIKNLQEMWDKIQSPQIWEQIRGFYSLESKNVLFQTMQLYSKSYKRQINISPFGEEFCRPLLQKLSKHKEFRCTPQGRELEKQRNKQFGNTLSFLPHEIALAAKAFEERCESFYNWHRQESIKGYGNAIVPQVAFQIFKVIEQLKQRQ